MPIGPPVFCCILFRHLPPRRVQTNEDKKASPDEEIHCKYLPSIEAISHSALHELHRYSSRTRYRTSHITFTCAWSTSLKGKVFCESNIRSSSLVDPLETVEPITKRLDQALLEAHRKSRSAQMGLAEKDAAHHCSSQVSRLQIRALQVGKAQIGTLQVCLAQPCPAQRRFFEVRSLETRTLQIRPAQIGFCQVSLAQIGAYHVCPVEQGLAQVGSAQVGPFLPDVCLSDNDPHLLACEVLALKGIHGYTTLAFRLTLVLLLL